MAKPLPPPPTTSALLPKDPNSFHPEDRPIEKELSYPILLSERVKKSAAEAAFFKSECAEVSRQADRLSHLLRSAVRFTTTTTSTSTSTSSSSSYTRPVRRISYETWRNLELALTLTRKCRRRSFIRRVVNIVSVADFRRINSFLDASAADLRWLITVFDSSSSSSSADPSSSSSGIILSLPPIASNDPILAWVWSFVASVHMGPLPERIEAATELASLGLDNDRNKKMIAEEGGIPPLLKLLKEDSSPVAQIAAASALRNLANEQERADYVVRCLGVPVIVQVLHTSPMRVQIEVAKLVGRMSEFSHVAKEEFARENVIRPLVSLLSLDTFEDYCDQTMTVHQLVGGKHDSLSIHSIVQMNKELAGKKKDKKDSQWQPRLSSSSSFLSGGISNGGGQYRKEREKESPEVKRQMKVSCSEALWMLARDSISNSRRITETKGLLCLAKLVEKEEGELQRNCMNAIMEIATAAEWNADLRRSAFKSNNPAAKAVVAQILRLIEQPDIDPSLKIPAIKSIGCLARTFPARESRVIGPLVDQLSSLDREVAKEGLIALEKFVSPQNFLCREHSKSIIEFNGVLPLMRLLRGNDPAQLHALVLLCYLAIHASDNEVLEQLKVLTALEAADQTMPAQNQPELKELIRSAIYQLKMYQNAEIPPLGQQYSL